MRTSVHTDVDLLHNDVDALRNDVDALREDVAQIREEIRTLQQDTKENHNGMGGIREEISEVKISVARMEGPLLRKLILPN